MSGDKILIIDSFHFGARLLVAKQVVIHVLQQYDAFLQALYATCSKMSLITNRQ